MEMEKSYKIDSYIAKDGFRHILIPTLKGGIDSYS